MSNVLIIGQLGYHEDNVTLPIIAALEQAGATVVRQGDVFDFFDRARRFTMPVVWSGAVPPTIEDIDAIFFVDWWNMTLPMVLYRGWKEDVAKLPRLSAMCHGTVRMEGDVACQIPRAEMYERFLRTGYNAVLCHTQWCVDLLASPCAVLTPHPYDFQLQRERPALPPKPRIIFPHRWSTDKGADTFLEFVAHLRGRGIPWEVHVTADPVAEANSLDIKFWGRVDQDHLKAICSAGGYVWAAPRSELAAYAVHDCISYGLTPLVSNTAIGGVFNHIPARFRWATPEEAVMIVQRGESMRTPDWEEMMRPHRFNSARIARCILGTAQWQ